MPRTVVAFGEIMLRLKPPGYDRIRQAHSFEALFAGAEANMLVSLAMFGMPTRCVTRLPHNDLGDACCANLRQYGVGVESILRGGERMGLYFIESGAAQRGGKVIYDRANSSFAEIQPGMLDWEQVFDGAGWFHWTGITPALSESAAAVCLEAVKAARLRGLAVSCDFNYRRNLWKWGKTVYQVMPELVRSCSVFLGSEDQARMLLDGESAAPPPHEQPAGYLQSVAGRLVEAYPNLDTVAFTCRESLSASHNRWTGVLWRHGRFYEGPTYDILPVVERIGAGDAFAAGLVYGFDRYPDDPAQALRFALAASCLKHSIPGDFNLVTVDEVERLMSGDETGRVAR